MLKSLVIANWKCNPASQREAKHLLTAIENEIKKTEGVEVIICPPFIYCSLLANHSLLKLGAQDCFWKEKGAYTGEISPLMLKNLDCQYVIIGHSERRKHFQETDSVVNKKLKAALKARLRPILCIGEEARDAFNSEGRLVSEMSLAVGEQLEKDLSGISVNQIRDIVIAYEPIWAIGTGNPCSSNDAMKAALFIRKTLSKLYNRTIAEKVRILYGGSVNSQNAVDYTKKARIDGLLIGGASLNASEFVKIITNLRTVIEDSP